MFPSGAARFEFDVQRCALRRPVDVVSLRHEGAELLPDSVLPQPAVIFPQVFEFLLRDPAPEMLSSDVCDGGLR